MQRGNDKLGTAPNFSISKWIPNTQLCRQRILSVHFRRQCLARNRRCALDSVRMSTPCQPPTRSGAALIWCCHLGSDLKWRVFSFHGGSERITIKEVPPQKGTGASNLVEESSERRLIGGPPFETVHIKRLGKILLLCMHLEESHDAFEQGIIVMTHRIDFFIFPFSLFLFLLPSDLSSATVCWKSAWSSL